MAKNFRQLRAAMDRDPAARAEMEIYARAMRDAVELGNLRDACGVTQKEIAATLGMSQANVSRIEHEEDLYLSTLRDYVAALGGRLEVVAVFPEETIAVRREPGDLAQPGPG